MPCFTPLTTYALGSARKLPPHTAKILAPPMDATEKKLDNKLKTIQNQ